MSGRTAGGRADHQHVPDPIRHPKDPRAIAQGCMRTSQRRRWLIPLVVLLGLVCTLGNAFVVAEPAGAATMLFVSASGTDTNPCSSTAPCATITHALSLAVSGDTIEVAGHIFDSVTVTTTITIEQWPGQAPAVVDASLQPNHSVFFNSSGNLTLDGLTVTGGSSLTGAGIDTFGAETTTVNDSTITGNTATVPPMSPGGGAIGGGIDIRDSGNFIITDSTISGNTAEGDTQTNFPGMGEGAAAAVSTTSPTSPSPTPPSRGTRQLQGLRLAARAVVSKTTTGPLRSPTPPSAKTRRQVLVPPAGAFRHSHQPLSLPPSWPATLRPGRRTTALAP